MCAACFHSPLSGATWSFFFLAGIDSHVGRYVDDFHAPGVAGFPDLCSQVCRGLCLWCHVLGDHVQIFTPRLCMVPGHLPALSWFRVSISLSILMGTCEVEPWAPAPPPPRLALPPSAPPPSAPPPQGWAFMIHLWEEKDSPSLMDEAVPEAFAFRRGFRSGYQVRGQTLAFQALPPSQVTDKPSWDKEPLNHSHSTSATPRP